MKPRVSLDELFSTVRGTLDPARFPNEPFALFSIPAYDVGIPEMVNGNEIGSAKQVVRAGDVLLSRIVPHIRRAWVVKSQQSRRLVASSEWFVFASDRMDPEYLRYAFLSDQFHREFMTTVGGVGGSLLRAQRDQVAQLEIPEPPLEEQRAIAAILQIVSDSISLEQAVAAQVNDLKWGLMRRIFTGGVCGEAQKQTEIGLIPESWVPTRLDSVASTISTRMTYEDIKSYTGEQTNDSLRVLGVKVSDMNLAGNEVLVRRSAIERMLPESLAVLRCAPPGTIVFPKRGAAIATNKKRMTTTWTVFDPNVIGVTPGINIDGRFLYYWFEHFDLRTITEPGPTPQLNKKNVDPLVIPLPHIEEQRTIAELLGSLDDMGALHRAKLSALQELFQSLLNSLVGGEIRTNDVDLSVLSKSA